MWSDGLNTADDPSSGLSQARAICDAAKSAKATVCNVPPSRVKRIASTFVMPITLATVAATRCCSASRRDVKPPPAEEEAPSRGSTNVTRWPGDNQIGTRHGGGGGITVRSGARMVDVERTVDISVPYSPVYIDT